MYEYKATVVRVVDGDTIYADIQLGFYMTARLSLRILGVDTPEVRGSTKEAGRAAADFTRSLLPVGCEVVVRTEKGDSFGRWLAQVILPDGRDLSRVLLESGQAVPYAGR